MEIDSFITARPAINRLTPYIDYYYFHESRSMDGAYEFVFYPNTHNALTIYKNSVLENLQIKSVAVPSDQEFFVCYSAIQPKAFHVHIKRPYTKIGVVFKPLGFNHFIKEKLSELVPEKHGVGAINGEIKERLAPVLRQVFQETDSDKKVKLLDAFFVSEQKSFGEERLKKSVDLITRNHGNINVNEVATEVGLSRRTIGRLFLDHCRCSPKTYINVVKFRRALKLYMDAANKPRLIDVALGSEFYDQSEFIHHFKKFTGYNPRKELKEILSIGEADTFWKLR
ncbi:MAG TPA: helix-turn-helix domain-containing protein [Cryomorphaceae bacterium]|nr:helix-turn-helix domain-containing protein [Cryomorphaceae bacterium]